MARETKISWARSTFNPWIGCTEVSPDCDGCYARELDRRWRGGVHWGAGSPRLHTSLKYWNEPYKWNIEAMRTKEFWPVFGGSLCDVFDNEVQDSWRADYWKLIERTRALTWLLLTKRVGNVMKMIPPAWRSGLPPNVWIVMSTGTQELFDRDMPKLAEIPAVVRGVSAEPLRGRVCPKTQWQGILHWMIFGGESAQADLEPRECKIEWIEDGIMNCRAFGVVPFVKQMGTFTTHRGKRVIFGGKGDDPSDWPEHLRVQEWPR